MSVILGLNTYHGDSSACLIVGDRIVGAVEEERLNRVKHWAGLPVESARWCLESNGLKLADVDHIAVNRDPNANLLRKLALIATKPPELRMLLNRWRNRSKVKSVREALEAQLGAASRRAQFHHVEHHLAHLASAYYGSRFEEALTLSVDAFGDFGSVAVGEGKGSEISVDRRVYFPHSLGAFYTAITQYLGFPHYGDEYKVMGLAPYGEPRYVRELSSIVKKTPNGLFELDLRFFVHHIKPLTMEWDDGVPTPISMFSPALEALLGEKARSEDQPIEQKHKDIARSAQAVYEDVFFHIVNSALDASPSKNLALAGGCAYNSVANGKITACSPIENVYVHAAAGDSGGALGAAYVVWHRINPGRRGPSADDPYLGPKFEDSELTKAIDRAFANGRPASVNIDFDVAESVLISRTARAIADGKVVGWFQGGVEWGPRALGNRSILCDPRRSDMKEILNRKIKRRESFRPFAPSILREEVPNWFEIDGDVPFMMQVFPIRKEKRSTIPAVTHIDGTGRLQTVIYGGNPRYYRLISEFQKLTGVPCVLNTSFNENEPIVCRPQEALDCFLRTNMDVLVLGSHMIERVT